MARRVLIKQVNRYEVKYISRSTLRTFTDKQQHSRYIKHSKCNQSKHRRIYQWMALIGRISTALDKGGQ